MLSLSQFLVVSHERNVALKCGRGNHPVGRISGERITKLTCALSNVIRERFDAIFGSEISAITSPPGRSPIGLV